MTTKMYATVCGFVFGLVAAGHLARAIAQSEFVVAGWIVPSWVSLIATFVAGYLSYSGFRIGVAAKP